MAGPSRSLIQLLPFLHLALALALPSPLSRRASNSGDVLIQMFDWNWDSVASECTKFIGPAGYKYVQVSPAQEHIEGSQWWVSYQAVSYDIQSRRGSRDQYKNMVDTCNAAGVGIVADVIVNHMAGIDSGTGVAGHSFTHYNYPSVSFSEDNFHKAECGTTNYEISDWTNATQIQNCQLSNLADLKTETDYVREKVSGHLKDLLSLGVSGFRIDAAKHIPINDLKTIISAAGTPEYITQEIVWASGTIQPKDYQAIGDVTEFLYQSRVKDAFLGNDDSSISQLEKIGNDDFLDGSKSNVFVSNHDSERGGEGLSVSSPSNTLVNANIFLLAFPYGHPTILSSFKYSQSDDGAPNGGSANCDDSNSGYNCQHRAVGGLVQFRNNAQGEAVSDWVSPQGNRIAFGRGSKGFVVINNSDGEWQGTFKTQLEDGTYCEVVASTDCSKKITVSGGSFDATVSGRSSIAIHSGSKA